MRRFQEIRGQKERMKNKMGTSFFLWLGMGHDFVNSLVLCYYVVNMFNKIVLPIKKIIKTETCKARDILVHQSPTPHPTTSPSPTIYHLLYSFEVSSRFYFLLCLTQLCNGLTFATLCTLSPTWWVRSRTSWLSRTCLSSIYM